MSKIHIGKHKLKQRTLWCLFIDTAKLLQGERHFEEAVYFLPPYKFPEILGIHFINLKRMKD